jgi:hypothetical protein
VILAGFPCVRPAILESDLLTFFVNEFPLSDPIRACARYARISSAARNEVIDFGGLDRLLQELERPVPDVKFSALCDFAKGMATWETDAPAYSIQIAELFVKLSELAVSPEPRYLAAVLKVAENNGLASIIPQLGIFPMLVKHRASGEAQWQMRAAHFLCHASVQARDALLPDLLLCWQLVLDLLQRFLKTDEIAVPAARALIGLVATSVAAFIDNELVEPIVQLFPECSYDVKCQIAAAVSAAFCEASAEEYVVLAEHYGLGGLVLTNLPNATQGSACFGLILHGIIVYLEKMAVLPTRVELFRTQVIENEEFQEWMKEMEETNTVDSFGVGEEWDGLTALVRSIEQSFVSA